MMLLARVSYSYGQREVLRDVEMRAKRGELLAIIGPNGAGKSTLLKSLVGILMPKGRVELDGIDILSLKPAERAKLIAYVPQSSFPEFAFTVEEFVEMGSYMTRGSVEGALKKVGLWGKRKERITALSGGEFQLALIARALAQGSRAVLLDEPTSHLDVNHVLMVMGLLKRLREEKIIVTVLHDVNLALEYADRIVVMKDGEKFWEGKPEEITPDVLERVYNVKAQIVEVDSHRVFIPELAKV